MVFFFIAYLITIFIFCSPFSICFKLYFSNSEKKPMISLKIGPLTIPLTIPMGKKKKKSERKKIAKKHPPLFRIRKIKIPKAIEYSTSVLIVLPKKIVYLDEVFIGDNIRKVFGVVRQLSSDKIFLDVVKSERKIYCLAVLFRIKYNLTLIFSALLQTIKVGR